MTRSLLLLKIRNIVESVYIFALINICLSLSDGANKIESMNIERIYQCQLCLKI